MISLQLHQGKLYKVYKYVNIESLTVLICTTRLYTELPMFLKGFASDQAASLNDFHGGNQKNQKCFNILLTAKTL